VSQKQKQKQNKYKYKYKYKYKTRIKTHKKTGYTSPKASTYSINPSKTLRTILYNNKVIMLMLRVCTWLQTEMVFLTNSRKGTLRADHELERPEAADPFSEFGCGGGGARGDAC
jgi:hypothetical protein